MPPISLWRHAALAGHGTGSGACSTAGSTRREIGALRTIEYSFKTSNNKRRLGEGDSGVLVCVRCGFQISWCSSTAAVCLVMPVGTPVWRVQSTPHTLPRHHHSNCGRRGGKEGFAAAVGTSLKSSRFLWMCFLPLPRETTTYPAVSLSHPAAGVARLSNARHRYWGYNGLSVAAFKSGSSFALYCSDDVQHPP